jgi:hypothetical protein
MAMVPDAPYFMYLLCVMPEILLTKWRELLLDELIDAMFPL